MSRSRRSSFGVGLGPLAGCAALLLLACGAAADVPLAAEVRVALDARVGRLGPLDIEIDETDTVAGDLADADPPRTRHRRVAWDAAGRLAQRVDELGRDGEPRAGVFIFDGTDVLTVGHGDVASARDAADWTGTVPYGGYFDAIGLVPPRDGAALLAKRASSDDTALARALAGTIDEVVTVDLDGRPCVRVRVRRPNEWRQRAVDADLDEVEAAARAWPQSTDATVALARDNVVRMRALPRTFVTDVFLDTALGHAVVRIGERFDDGRPSRRIVCAEFERVGSRELWLPRRCVDEIYWQNRADRPLVVSDVPLRTQAAVVTRLAAEVAPDDAIFAPPPVMPDAVVVDERRPIVEGRNAVPDATANGRSATRWGGSTWASLLFTVLAAVGVLAMVIVRSRRRGA